MWNSTFNLDKYATALACPKLTGQFTESFRTIISSLFRAPLQCSIMASSSIRDILTAFSPSLDFLAISSGDGRIKVQSEFKLKLQWNWFVE